LYAHDRPTFWTDPSGHSPPDFEDPLTQLAVEPEIRQEMRDSQIAVAKTGLNLATVGQSGALESAIDSGRINAQSDSFAVLGESFGGAVESVPGAHEGLDAYAAGQGSGGVALAAGKGAVGISDFETAFDSSKPIGQRIRAGAIGTVKAVTAVLGGRSLLRRFVGKGAAAEVAVESAAADASTDLVPVGGTLPPARPLPRVAGGSQGADAALLDDASFVAPNTGTSFSPILERQRELSHMVNRQGRVVDRWLGASDNRWARLYREVESLSPNFSKGIRGRILDVRMRGIFRERFGDVPGVRIDQTIPGTGSNLRPDLYFPDLGGRKVIFDVGSPSKIQDIGKYKGMADEAIPLVPLDWVP